MSSLLGEFSPFSGSDLATSKSNEVKTTVHIKWKETNSEEKKHAQ